MIFLVDKDNEFAQGLCEKIAIAKPRAIVELSAGEMDLYLSDRFTNLTPNETNVNLVEIKPNVNYMYVIDGDKFNIDDVTSFMGYVENIGSSVCIIRTRG